MPAIEEKAVIWAEVYLPLPCMNRLGQLGEDVVPLVSYETVHRPDAVWVTTSTLKNLEILKRTGEEAGLTCCPAPP